MIKFSVITVCLNAGDDLLETVRNTLSQSYSTFEIIVKDGLSTDGSVESLPADSRIRVERKKDTGIYDAMNQALDFISGDYVIFMNCGDKFYSKDTLELIARQIAQDHNQLYYGLCYNRKMNHVNAYPRKLTPFTCYRTSICHQSTIYAASLFQDRRYDTSFPILGDKEMMTYLVCEKKLQPTYIDEIIVDYQAGGECESEKYRKKNALDQDRLVKRYFPPRKRILYKTIHALTLPKLRSRLTENPKFSAVYYRFFQFVYKFTGRGK